MQDKLTEEEKFLLLGKLSGSLSPEEEIAVERLFRENPAAEAAYEALVQEVPVEDTVTYFAHRTLNPGWKDIVADFRRQAVAPPKRVIPLFTKKWIAAAAITAIIAGAGTIFFLKPFNKQASQALVMEKEKPGIELTLSDGKVIDLTNQQGAITAGDAQLNNTAKSLSYSVSGHSNDGTNVLNIPVGSDYKIRLADGSEIWLNSKTRLEFPLSFTGSSREIKVNGEAFIKVARDAAKPFIVHLPQSSVQVLGTAFNVNTYDEGIEKVALVEGAVNLKAPSGESKIPVGHQAIYTKGQTIEQQSFDPKFVLSWRTGLHYFNDASLMEISKVIPRWFGVQVKIEGASISTRRFTGVINRNEPIAVFLDDLKAIAKIESWFDKEGDLHLK